MPPCAARATRRRSAGRSTSLWHDIWDQVEPILARAYAGEAIHMDDIAFVMHRHGYPEETHFAFSYTPVRDESGRGRAACSARAPETTGQVLAERRTVAERERLQELFEQAPGFMAMLRGPEHVFELVNPAYMQLVGHRDVIGKPVRAGASRGRGPGLLRAARRGLREAARPFGAAP